MNDPEMKARIQAQMQQEFQDQMQGMQEFEAQMQGMQAQMQQEFEAQMQGMQQEFEAQMQGMQAQMQQLQLKTEEIGHSLDRHDQEIKEIQLKTEEIGHDIKKIGHSLDRHDELIRKHDQEIGDLKWSFQNHDQRIQNLENFFQYAKDVLDQRKRIREQEMEKVYNVTRDFCEEFGSDLVESTLPSLKKRKLKSTLIKYAGKRNDFHNFGLSSKK